MVIRVGGGGMLDEFHRTSIEERAFRAEGQRG